jgi:cell division protein FtsB
MVALGLTALFATFALGLFALCKDRQNNFEDKLVELEGLKAERQSLRVHNERMRERVAYLGTDEGIEEVAREKLGLVRPGELAYAVVPPPPDSFLAADEKESPHLDSAQSQDKHEEDFGVIVRVLRHLFGPEVPSADADAKSVAGDQEPKA